MNKKPVIELKGIKKSFPGVVALKGFDLNIYEQEILGLVGENGAGKSTLMKVLIGINQPDEGQMILRDEDIILKDPLMAIKYGIGMVFQEGCMIPNLTIAENLFLGHEDVFRKNGLLSNRKMMVTAKEVLEKVGMTISPSIQVGKLSSAQKQMTEIARLLWLSRLYERKNPVLILDEPTTVLVEKEVETLFNILEELKKDATIIFISHRLGEVIAHSDRVVVLKDGDFVTEMPGSEATEKKIEQLMVGRDLADEHFRESEQRVPDEKELLRVENLALEGKFEPLSFTVREGEILSLVGLIGSGKEEVCKCITGIEKNTSGKIYIDGELVKLYSPKDSIQRKLGYIPIDRRKEGLATELSVAENVNMLVLPRLRTSGFLNSRMEKKNAGFWSKETGVRAPSLKSQCGNLSGGNQQKVVISKWLAADSQVLILDHPTRGIDVGAKDDIYHRIRELAKSGKGLIIMCDTLEEDIGLSNRMLIMKDGKLMEERDCPRDKKPTPLDVIASIV